jgi:MoaA/NifB/PqqE/SkfB family radical SAM enzyme
MSADFDEEFYLAYNQDVAAAGARGAYTSGREHFEAVGLKEGRLHRKLRKAMHFYIDVFSYCNLRCPTCVVGNKYGGVSDWPRGIMHPSLLESILDKATSECDVSGVGLFNWTEPLLHPNISELVSVVKKRNIGCTLSSNLNVLREPEKLLAAGLDWLRVSLSGFTQETYERGHQGGNIEVVKANMERLAAAKASVGASTDLEVFYHIYRYNRDEIETMSAFARSLARWLTSHRWKKSWPSPLATSLRRTPRY